MKGRVILLGAGVLLLVVAGGLIGMWLYANLVFGLTLTDQPGMVLFPPETTTNAVAKNKITIKLNGYINADVPFKQILDLPLEGHYDTEARFDTVVPVQFTIRYKGVIPVDTFATIHGVTDFNYQKVKLLRNVHFTAQIPLRFEQPVSLVVPVKANLRLAYDGPLAMYVNQTVSAPVDTVLHTRLLAMKEITTPILARFGMRVRWPKTLVPVIIKHADLRLILSRLKLERAVQPAAEPAPAPAKVEPAT